MPQPKLPRVTDGRWRIAVLTALVALLWACQDCPLLAVRLGAVVAYPAGLALVVSSRAAALACVGLTVVGAGVFVGLDMAARLPFAGTVTGAVLATVVLLGARATPAPPRSGRELGL